MSKRNRRRVYLVRPKWHVFLVFALVFVPVALYGVFSVKRTWFSPLPYAFCEQGWPWGFLERDIDEWKRTRSILDLQPYESLIELHSGERWRVFRKVRRFSRSLLLANLGVALLIGAGVAVFWHVHAVQNARPWQFNLKEMICMTVGFAALLSCWGVWQKQYERERQVFEELRTIGWDVPEPAIPVLPDCIMRPWIDSNLPTPRCVWRVGAIVWDAQGRGAYVQQKASLDRSRWSNVNEMLQEIAPRLRVLRSKAIVVYDSELTDVGVEALCRNISDCRQADFAGAVTDAGVLCLVTHWPNIEWLALYDTAISDEGAAHLSKLSKLSSLELEGADRLSVEAARHLVKIPKLTHLSVPGDWIEQSRRLDAIMDGREDIQVAY